MSLAYKRHQLSAAFPDMPEDEFEELVQDIAAHGLQHKIMLFQGQIIDGWHRYRATLEAMKRGARVSLRIETYSGNDPAGYVKSHNLMRRHLTGSQRAYAVAELGKWAPAGRPAEKGEPGSPLVTVPAQAKEAGVSDRTMQQAKRVSEDGSAVLKEAVREGDLSVKAAAPIAVLPKSEQRSAVKEAKAPKPRAEKPDAVIPASEVENLNDRLYETNSLLRAEEAKCAALEEENAQLKKVIDADDRLAEMEKRVVRYQEKSRIAEERVIGLQNERNNAIRLSNSWKAKAEKAAKASA